MPNAPSIFVSVADCLKFNFLPSKYPEDYKNAVKLLADKYPEILKADNKHSKHVRDFYLNDDPCKLGGRCCPLPGQASSNNGGEKNVGNTKEIRTFPRFSIGRSSQNSLYGVNAPKFPHRKI